MAIAPPPSEFNAATYFIDRHLETATRSKIAFIDDATALSYEALAAEVNRAGNAMRATGLDDGDRVALLMLDTVALPALFWGAVKAGFTPVPLNTQLTVEHLVYVLNDCGARLLCASASLWPALAQSLGQLRHLEQVWIDGATDGDEPRLAAVLGGLPAALQGCRRLGSDTAFWLYSSGSTGAPKGVVHRHESLYYTARSYGEGIVDLRSDDVVYSAAKLFFAYGLGNSMTFPLNVGATAVLSAARPTPERVARTLSRHRASVFFGVPTLYAALLADVEASAALEQLRLRLCVSAGEALPADVGERWQRLTGAPLLDGVGSTEMLHIFMSNRVDDLCYGTSGRPVPGYAARLVDDDGRDVAAGEIGELLVAGRSSAECYWNQPEKTAQTFRGDWTATGDKYYQDAAGRYRICGRTDDMFKSGGNWVSPFDVEAALIAHPAVLEAGVVGHADEHGNLKPKAYVVLRPGEVAGPELTSALQDHVKSRLELWKYPRRIEYRAELPKTATGKIQRFKLREADA